MTPVSSWLRFPSIKDPRIPVALILFGYLVLGMTVLGFNRSPLQVAITVATAIVLDMVFHRLLVGGAPLFPFSALITGMGLSILINYAHGYWYAAIPPLFAIGSKYLVTLRGRHFYNPTLVGVVVCLLLMDGMISPSPAYQWGGSYAIAAFIVTLALFFFALRIDRMPLILSFLGFYSVGLLLRAWLTRYHVPMETWLMGALTAPAFYLFTFFMITDPQTSPSDRRKQILVGFFIAAIDFLLHLKESLSTFFIAAFICATLMLAWEHVKTLRDGWPTWAAKLRFGARRWASLGTAGALLWFGAHSYAAVEQGAAADFTLVELASDGAGISGRQGDIFQRVDPRVAHIAKWMLSVGDAAAVADIDNDGLQDVFLTYPLKDARDRGALYRNLGNFKFARVALPALDEIDAHPELHGLPSGAMFFDYDNDGDQDLLVTMGYGKSRLLQNQLSETGTLAFIDVTAQLGLGEYNISIAANAADYDHDGKLDLVIANVMSPTLRAYDTPVQLNIFKLPDAAFAGDRRMFDFMHRTWHNANNGGGIGLWHNTGSGFVKLPPASLGLVGEQRWTTSVGFADLDGDGWPDLYASNDFGPDQLLLNQRNGHFAMVRGDIIGQMGRDTYKGMNVTVADFDNNGFQDLYISNVHEKLQAEGSLLWMNSGKPGTAAGWSDQAAGRNVLNERRFGWGAAAGDIDLDGRLDLVQANGMVDDAYDKQSTGCPDYWYWNDKIALTRPDVHGFADRWADLRGRCIFPHEQNRVYLNHGRHFVDVAAQVGFTRAGTSRGVVMADLDNDGRLDLLVTHQFAPVSLYRNQAKGAAAGWLGLDLRGNGASCNRDAIGTKVVLTYEQDGKIATQWREVMTVNGFSAQNDRRLLFGLGHAAPSALKVAITWCGQGPPQEVMLGSGRYHALRQP
jgi:Na+-translocating ferredoxin:NAD+ oxidoreductase RnfD subunit